MEPSAQVARFLTSSLKQLSDMHSSTSYINTSMVIPHSLGLPHVEDAMEMGMEASELRTRLVGRASPLLRARQTVLTVSPATGHTRKESAL